MRIPTKLDNPMGKIETLAQRPKIWSCRGKLERENDSAYSARERQTEILETRQRQTGEEDRAHHAAPAGKIMMREKKQAAHGRHRENMFLGVYLCPS
jgi:hypothetical protein